MNGSKDVPSISEGYGVRLPGALWDGSDPGSLRILRTSLDSPKSQDCRTSGFGSIAVQQAYVACMRCH